MSAALDKDRGLVSERDKDLSIRERERERERENTKDKRNRKSKQSEVEVIVKRVREIWRKRVRNRHIYLTREIYRE